MTNELLHFFANKKHTSERRGTWQECVILGFSFSLPFIYLWSIYNPHIKILIWHYSFVVITNPKPNQEASVSQTRLEPADSKKIH